MAPRELERKLSDAEREFVYLKRQIPPETAARVAALGIPGIHQQSEYRRYYPGGETMAHVVGFTGVDDAGQEGIELAQQAVLAGAAGSRRVIKDRLGRIVEDVGVDPRGAGRARPHARARQQDPEPRLQRAARPRSRRTRRRRGAIVVLDVRTGEVLALANMPTYNPNNRARLTGAQLRNRVDDRHLRAGLDAEALHRRRSRWRRGTITPQTLIQTAPGTLTIGRLHDPRRAPGGALTVDAGDPEVLQRRRGEDRARRCRARTCDDMFQRVGFGAAPRLGFPGEATGAAAPVRRPGARSSRRPWPTATASR